MDNKQFAITIIIVLVGATAIIVSLGVAYQGEKQFEQQYTLNNFFKVIGAKVVYGADFRDCNPDPILIEGSFDNCKKYNKKHGTNIGENDNNDNNNNKKSKSNKKEKVPNDCKPIVTNYMSKPAEVQIIKSFNATINDQFTGEYIKLNKQIECKNLEDELQKYMSEGYAIDKEDMQNIYMKLSSEIVTKEPTLYNNSNNTTEQLIK